MKALSVFENIDFKRGISPKDSLGIGSKISQIFYNLEKRNKYKNLDLTLDADHNEITVYGENIPLKYNSLEGQAQEDKIEVNQTIELFTEEGQGKEYIKINTKLFFDNIRIKEVDASDPEIHGTEPSNLADLIENMLYSAEISLIEVLNEAEDLKYLDDQEW